MVYADYRSLHRTFMDYGGTGGRKAVSKGTLYIYIYIYIYMCSATTRKSNNIFSSHLPHSTLRLSGPRLDCRAVSHYSGATVRSRSGTELRSIAEQAQ